MTALRALTRQRPPDAVTAPLPGAPADAPRAIDLQLSLDFEDDTQPAAFNGLDGSQHDDNNEREQPRRCA